MNLEGDKRLNLQLGLDFSSVPTGEARQVGREDIESPSAVSEPERPANTSRIMEELFDAVGIDVGDGPTQVFPIVAYRCTEACAIQTTRDLAFVGQTADARELSALARESAPANRGIQRARGGG